MAVVEKWDSHVLVIDKVAPPNWKVRYTSCWMISCFLHFCFIIGVSIKHSKFSPKQKGTDCICMISWTVTMNLMLERAKVYNLYTQ